MAGSTHTKRICYFGSAEVLPLYTAYIKAYLKHPKIAVFKSAGLGLVLIYSLGIQSVYIAIIWNSFELFNVQCNTMITRNAEAEHDTVPILHRW
jgi:hypothetical protein